MWRLFINHLKRHEGVHVAFLSLIWFVILTPWGRFPDPDAFYHAHSAALMLAHGPLHAFSWLDLTSLGAHFANQHFLYHALLIPGILIAKTITASPVAELWATQAMAPLFATLTTLVLWAALKRLDPLRAWLWTTLTLLVPAFSLRMLLGKASPIAVGLFIVTLAVMVTRNRVRGIVLCALCGLLFALSHGGWMILILVAALMLFGSFLFSKLGEDRSWRDSIYSLPWKEFIALLIGIMLGLLLHPNRVELFHFLWVQIVRVGIAPPTGVMPGLEWLPAPLLDIVGDAATLVIATLLGCLGLLMASNGEQRRDTFRRLTILAMPVALTLALNLKSRRFSEYLIPSLALFVAALWRCVDTERLKRVLSEAVATWPQLLRRIAPTVMVILALWLIAHQTSAVWSALRREGARTFDAYRATFSVISARANPGDRVFHSDWDEFPVLFAADDRLRYVSGLDPVFLHDANPALAGEVRDLTLGVTTSSAWQVIVEKTGSRFIFVTTDRHPLFDKTLQDDPRFQELARDEKTAVYQVK